MKNYYYSMTWISPYRSEYSKWWVVVDDTMEFDKYSEEDDDQSLE